MKITTKTTTAYFHIRFSWGFCLLLWDYFFFFGGGGGAMEVSGTVAVLIQSSSLSLCPPVSLSPLLVKYSFQALPLSLSLSLSIKDQSNLSPSLCALSVWHAAAGGWFSTVVVSHFVSVHNVCLLCLGANGAFLHRSVCLRSSH